MTHLVLRSSIKDEKTFARDVDTHAEELRNYELHKAAVARGEAEHYPPPMASNDVNFAIRRPDFMRITKSLIGCLSSMVILPHLPNASTNCNNR
jgi:hypothetical protein